LEKLWIELACERLDLRRIQFMGALTTRWPC
jgi:hypothetical protein